MANNFPTDAHQARVTVKARFVPDPQAPGRPLILSYLGMRELAGWVGVILPFAAALGNWPCMAKHIFRLRLVACLVTRGLSAVNDPLVGKWKLNPSKSRFPDEMKVEAAGANKYAFDFGGGTPETIVADGTDQRGGFGTTLAVTVEGPDTWKVVRKKDGHAPGSLKYVHEPRCFRTSKKSAGASARGACCSGRITARKSR